MRIERYEGDRARLRPLFELAEDSRELLDAYVREGVVLVAWDDDEPLGHLQLVDTERPGVVEVKNMAVVETQRGTGIGRALVVAALELARGRESTLVLVVTGAADTGNLRFYQRVGFRMLSIERDAFTPEVGYPAGLVVDGVELRDRVWLDLELDTHSS